MRARLQAKRSGMLRAALPFAALGSVLACGCVASADVEETAGDVDAGSDSSVSSLPLECATTTPFNSAACGRALREICSQLDDEPSCARHAGFPFDNSVVYFRCGWSKVVQFSEIETCQVQSVTGRCDLYGQMPLSCANPCSEDDSNEFAGLYGSLQAHVGTRELVKSPCSYGSSMDGPLGEWLSRNDPQNTDAAYRTCGAHEPPPPKELCSCQRAACDAK